MVYCDVCEHSGKRKVSIMGVEREVQCYACQGQGKFITQITEQKAWWENEPKWFALLYNYDVELPAEP